MSWGDYNLENGEFEGKQIETTCEALRLALIERSILVRGGHTPLLSKEFSNTVPLEQWTTDFQTVMTKIMGRFVNHTDSGGDWSGEVLAGNVAPLWTEAAILSYLGETRLTPDRLFRKEWAEQQFRVLNLLLWVAPVKLPQTLIGITFEGVLYRKEQQESSTSWNDCKSIWNSQPWVQGSTGVDGTFQYVYRAIYNPAPEEWAIIQTDYTDFTITSNSTQFSADLYSFASSGTQFQPMGDSTVPDVFNLVVSTGIALSQNEIIFPNIEYISGIDPATIPDDDYGNTGSAGPNTSITVLKMDFEFKAA